LGRGDAKHGFGQGWVTRRLQSLLPIAPCCPMLLQELASWFKWVLYDAALTLLVKLLSERSTLARTLFETVGWL
jgi:hypothetical protein